MKTKDRMKHFVENEIISQVKDDPRDEIIIRSQELQKKIRNTSKEYAKAKEAYWDSLATPKRKQPPSTPMKDLTISEEETVVIRRCSDQYADLERINDLAKPRRTLQWDIDCRKCKCNCKVPLSTLLPRLKQLSAPKRIPDISEHIREDEDAFSVKKSALEYVATERLKRLATPRLSYQDYN